MGGERTFVAPLLKADFDLMQSSAVQEIRQLHGAQPDEVALLFAFSFFV
jgi:hypothetical protein